MRRFLTSLLFQDSQNGSPSATWWPPLKFHREADTIKKKFHLTIIKFKNLLTLTSIFSLLSYFRKWSDHASVHWQNLVWIRFPLVFKDYKISFIHPSLVWLISSSYVSFLVEHKHALVTFILKPNKQQSLMSHLTTYLSTANHR